jgi:hypothetical protein
LGSGDLVLRALLSGRTIGDELKTASPVTLTSLAVILGLLIAFIAAQVWDNVAHANEHVGQEATGQIQRIDIRRVSPGGTGPNWKVADIIPQPPLQSLQKYTPSSRICLAL